MRRSSAVDMYDSKKAKPDWKNFCEQPAEAKAAPGIEQTLVDPDPQADLELGDITHVADKAAGAVPKDTESANQFTWRDSVEQIMMAAQQDDPLIHADSGHAADDLDQSSSAQAGFAEEEVRALQTAAALGVVLIYCHITPKATPGSTWVKRFFVESLFAGLCHAAGPHTEIQNAGQVLEVCAPVSI